METHQNEQNGPGDSPSGDRKFSHAYVRPSGLRRMSPALYKAADAAFDFEGLPPDMTPWDVFRILDRGAKAMGWSRAMMDTLRLLYRYSQKEDWKHGSSPLVWPSNETLEIELDLTRSGLKKRLRTLSEAGLIAFKDSPTGHRYGHRLRDGTINLYSSYGIDLSPGLALIERAIEATAHHDAERRERAELRRRRTVARRTVVQAIETVRDYGLRGLDPSEIENRLLGRLAVVDRFTPLAYLLRQVEALEALREEIEDQVKFALGVLRQELAADITARGGDVPEAVFSNDRPGSDSPRIARASLPSNGPESAENEAFHSVESNPSGSHEGPLLLNTTESQSANAESSSSARQERSSRVWDSASSPLQQSAETPKNAKPRSKPSLVKSSESSDHGLEHVPLKLVLSILPDEIRAWMPPGDRPSWAALVDVLHMHLENLEISPQAWGAACQSLGRYGAAVSVAIIAAKGERIEKPDRYLRSMVYRAHEGELHLNQSVWGQVRKQQALPEEMSP